MGNQFNTRFNPFGRTQQQQQQPQQQTSFTQFPSSTQPFTQFAPQTGGQAGGSPSGNFQNVRLGNGPVVSQNQQFGLTSQQQQFPSFAPQQPFQPQQQQQRPFQPLQRFPAASGQEISGPTSTNFQTFGFPSTAPPSLDQPQILSLPDLPDAEGEAEAPRSRVPISSRPETGPPETVTFPRSQPVEDNLPESDLTASR